MKFNIISKNVELKDFCRYLISNDNEVVFVNGEFHSSDVIVYDTEFKSQIDPIRDCLKIEFSKEANPDVFNLSFDPVDNGHQIRLGCSLSGKGETKQELMCDICSVNQSVLELDFLKSFLNFDNVVKLFSDQPINSYAYCGSLNGNAVNNLYKSAKVSLGIDEKSKYRILEAGGTILTNDQTLGLPPEFVYENNQDAEKKIRDLLVQDITNIDDIRNELIKNRNPFVEWSNIFSKIGLKKLSQQFKDTGNERAKAVSF
jgi:hypothetical protein